MQVNQNLFLIHQVNQELNGLQHYKTTLQKTIIDFKRIVQNFEGQKKPQELRALASRIRAYAEIKLKSYHEERFGYIKQIASALANWFALGVFKTSSEIGIELANQILNSEPEALPSNQTAQPDVKLEQRLQQVLRETEAVQEHAAALAARVEEPPPPQKGKIKNKLKKLFTRNKKPTEKAETRDKKPKLWTRFKEKVKKKKATLQEQIDHTLKKELQGAVEEIISQQPAVAAVEIPVPVVTPKKSPAEQMREDITLAWGEGGKELGATAANVWQDVLRGAKVTGWKKEGNQARVTLEKEAVGAVVVAGISGARAILKNELNLTFVDENKGAVREQVIAIEGLYYKIAFFKEKPVLKLTFTKEIGEEKLTIITQYYPPYPMPIADAGPLLSRITWS